MVTAVFFIAVLNLGLGFGLCLLADSPWRLALPQLPQLPQRRKRGSEPKPKSEPIKLTRQDEGKLKDEWLAILEEAKLPSNSAVESMLWLVYLDLPVLRARLIPVDQHWWSQLELQDEQLTEKGTSLLNSLEVWAGTLAHHKQDPRHGQLACEFEELLLDQHFQAKSALEALLKKSNAESAAGEISRELASLFNSMDTVRDFISQKLSELLRDANRYELIDDLRKQDVESGAISRLGLERLFHEWWALDPDRLQLVSCVLVDIDRTAKINETLGTRDGDRLLAAFGELLRGLVRQDRGFDRVVRYDGQAYLLFLGETSLANAASGAERIRQTIEVSSFQVDEEAIDLTASFGVAEVGRTEALADFLRRLEDTVKEAKEAGRDRTFSDNGTGASAVSLPQYQVEHQEIHVSEQ